MKGDSVQGWFLHGIDDRDAPQSLEELAARFTPHAIDAQTLAAAAKWEPLIQGKAPAERAGWVPLAALADTRRGIATGANGFFLLSAKRAAELDLPARSLVPCIGRAKDVPGLVFDTVDFAALRRDGAKCLLLDIRRDPGEAERGYIASGEASGITRRYILRNRHPWYSMEQRPPAPIWASVFGRGDLEFIFNVAQAKSLTNFHCVYPIRRDPVFVRALTMVLNARAVRQGSRLHTRGYGGGLTKFEPNDLRSILVPDLRTVGSKILAELSGYLDRADQLCRTNARDDAFEERVSEAVLRAGEEAVAAPARLL